MARLARIPGTPYIIYRDKYHVPGTDEREKYNGHISIPGTPYITLDSFKIRG
jgi:hypothetical protein